MLKIIKSNGKSRFIEITKKGKKIEFKSKEAYLRSLKGRYANKRK